MSYDWSVYCVRMRLTKVDYVCSLNIIIVNDFLVFYLFVFFPLSD